MSDTTSEPVNSKPGEAYFLSLTVENFRCFGPKQTLDLSDGNGNPTMWNVILGENGTGKTTILRSLFGFQLDLRESHDGKYYLFLSWLFSDFNDNETELIAYFSSKFGNFSIDSVENIYNVNYINQKIANQISSNHKVFLKCFSYGVYRRFTEESSAIKSQNGETLFNSSALLISSESWLSQIDYAARIDENNSKLSKNLQRVKNFLYDLLPDVSDFRFELDGHRPIAVANVFGQWIPVRNLSDGYQITLAWVVDFASRMMDVYPDSENPFGEPAVCLVDEIDLHLHPRWQKQLVQTLRRVFPKTQFIVTAHSPLIVQADPETNLALFRREGNHVVIENEVDYIRNWRVDQILSSELFSEVGPYPPHIQAKLDERRTLLGKPTLTDDDQARIDAIDAELEALPAETRPDDMRTMDLLREAAALIEADSKR